MRNRRGDIGRFLLAALLVVSSLLPIEVGFAAGKYKGNQGKQGNTVTMLSYSDITVLEETDDHYLNKINTSINGSEQIEFGFTMGAGMNSFSEANFKTNSLPYIQVYDKNNTVVAKYDGGAGALKYYRYDSGSKTIYIGIDKNVLIAGDYVLEFGPEVCGNNPGKKLGVPVRFQFTTYGGATGEPGQADKTELNQVIMNAENDLNGIVVGDAVGEYPQSAVTAFQQAIADAKAVYNDSDITQADANNARDALAAAREAFQEARYVVVSGVAITSNMPGELEVGANGSATAEVTVQPNESRYKDVVWSSSANVTIDESTGVWTTNYSGAAWIKATSKKDGSKSQTWNFQIQKNPGALMVNLSKGTLADTVDAALAASSESYSDITTLTIITSADAELDGVDVAFIRTNFTAVQNMDLSKAKFAGNNLPAMAFQNCGSLVEVALPDNLTMINHSAFDGCTSLKKVNIPKECTNVAAYVFRNCTALESIEIPAKVASLGADAFEGCTSLPNPLRVRAIVPPSMVLGDAFQNSSLTTVLVPYGSGADYLAANHWKNYEIQEATEQRLTIEVGQTGGLQTAAAAALSSAGLNDADVDTLVIKTTGEAVLNESDLSYLKGSFATATKVDLANAKIDRDRLTGEVFSNKSVKEVILPKSLNTVGPNAFKDCRALETVVFPETLQKIGEGAFYNCLNLAIDSLPDSLESIGKETFYSCRNMALNKLPDSLVELGNSAFSNCSKIAIKEIPTGVKAIGDSTFSGCSGIKELAMPAGLQSIGESAFNGIGVERLVLPEGLTELGKGAFGSTALKEITLPDSLTVIPASAFYGCQQLETVTMSDGVTEIGDYAFGYANKLKIDKLPDALQTIGNYAFWRCSSLEIDAIPEGVTSIGSNAFADCTALPELLLVKAGNPPRIDASTFSNTQLATVQVPAQSLEKYQSDSEWSRYVLQGVKIQAESLSIDHSVLQMEIGDTMGLVATVKPSTAIDVNVIWSSSNENVATVDETGVVTAVGKGTAVITATVEGSDAIGARVVNDECLVTVLETDVENQNPEQGEEKDTPKTGDSTSIWLFVVLMAASFVIGLTAMKKKKA